MARDDWKQAARHALTVRPIRPTINRFFGDPGTAAQLLPLAQSLLGGLLARLALGGINQGAHSVTLGDGSAIRVITNSGINIIEISVPTIQELIVPSSGFYYQFIATGDPVQIYTSGLFSAIKGSAVAVKLPGMASPFDPTQLNPVATGSMLEEIGTEPVSESNQTISRIKNITQVQLVPEPSYYSAPDPAFQLSNTQLLYSWSSIPGQVFNAGAYMLAPSFRDTDKFYDLPPTTLQGTTAESRMPDADWPHDACIRTVSSNQYGTRQFIVMVDASSRFYCWPTQYANSSTDYLYPEDSPYIIQAIKTNVDDAQVVSVTPPFPSWVYVPDGQRRDTDPEGVNSGEPRYPWRFHPAGTKAVGIALKRESLGAKRIYGRTLVTKSDIPFEEVDTGVNLEVAANQRPAPINYQGPIKSDWPGYVEFAINITITGPNREDFLFSLTLTRHQQATATRYPIAADYLTPVYGGWPAHTDEADAGDLIVMDLKSYIDQRSQTWIDREPGYKGSTAEKVRQSWVIVRNEESGSEIRKFLTRDNPQDFRVKQYDLNLSGLKTHTGTLKHIDLSTLSFVYQVRKRKYDVDPAPYATVTGRDYDTNWNNFKVRQRWRSEETGVRYYALNEIVLEDRGGLDLGLWEGLDDIDLFSQPIQISPLETGIKWLWSRSIVDGDSYPDRHWLVQYIPGYWYRAGVGHEAMSDVFRDGTNPVIGIMPDNHAPNILLKYMATLSATTTGDQVYRIREQAAGNYVAFSAGYSVDGNPPIEGYVDTYAWSTTDYSPVAISGLRTDIRYRLGEGVQTVDESYFDNVLVPWFIECFNDLVTGYEIAPNRSDSATVSVYHGQHVLTDDGIKQYCENKSFSFTYAQNKVEVSNKPGYSPRFGYGGGSPQGLFPEVFFAKGGNYTYDPEEFYRVGIDSVALNNPNLRVYGYPIGAEWMMREWNHAVVLDANFSLCVHPSGYYAGAMMTPCCNQPQPDTSLFSRYVYHEFSPSAYVDLYNEPHFNDFPYNHGVGGATVNVPENQFTFADASFSYIYEPSPAEFEFIPIDIIGRVGHVETTSHQSLLEQAYGHVFGISAPGVSITITDYQYIPQKIVGGENSPIYDETLNFLRPRWNGSMLFSN